MESKEWIDRVKVTHGLASDYAVAKYLGTSTQRISSYRTGTTEFDEDMAARLVAVDILGRLPLRTDGDLAACHIDRDGNLFVPGLGRSVHAGDLLSLSLLPQLFSALRAESETQKRQAKRLAFLERDIRLVRQLGLIGTTLSA